MIDYLLHRGHALITPPPGLFVLCFGRYMQTKKATADLTRARLTVQHAHHYFTKALNICDAVRGNSLGRATVGVFGGDVAALSKLCDYRGELDYLNYYSIRRYSSAPIGILDLVAYALRHE